MFCSKCGFKLDNSANFCGNCGAPVSAEQKKAVQAFNAASDESFSQQVSQTVTEAPKTEVDEFFAPLPTQQAAWGGQPYAAPTRICPYCKSEVVGGATYCPTCKSFVAAQPTKAQEEQLVNKRNTFSLLAFFIALASIFRGSIAGGVVSIIFGSKALKQIKSGKGKGKDMAIWGIILGVVAIIVSIVLIAWMISSGYLDYETTYPNGGVIL